MPFKHILTILSCLLLFGGNVARAAHDDFISALKNAKEIRAVQISSIKDISINVEHNQKDSFPGIGVIAEFTLPPEIDLGNFNFSKWPADRSSLLPGTYSGNISHFASLTSEGERDSLHNTGVPGLSYSLTWNTSSDYAGLVPDTRKIRIYYYLDFYKTGDLNPDINLKSLPKGDTGMFILLTKSDSDPAKYLGYKVQLPLPVFNNPIEINHQIKALGCE